MSSKQVSQSRREKSRPKPTPEAKPATARRPSCQKLYGTTDDDNAERLIDFYGADLRYCEDQGIWYVWNGKVWVPDPKELRVMARAKDVARRIPLEKALLIDSADGKAEKMKKAIRQHAHYSRSAPGLERMVRVARSIPSVLIGSGEFDADRMILNCQNGILNLKTGKLEPHRREALCTKILRIDYDSHARCPQFMDFLELVTGGTRDSSTITSGWPGTL